MHQKDEKENEFNKQMFFYFDVKKFYFIFFNTKIDKVIEVVLYFFLSHIVLLSSAYVFIPVYSITCFVNSVLWYPSSIIFINSILGFVN